MSMDQARVGALERKAAQLGVPGNLQLADWAMGMEAMLKDIEAIMDERSEALTAKAEAASEMARAARDFARDANGVH